MPETPLTFRPTKEDKTLLAKLVKNTGVKTSDVIRLALRSLAKERGI